MKTKFQLFICFLFLSVLNLSAENKEFKFGKVELSDMQITKCPIDSGANAYYIGDYGYVTFEYNDTKGFQSVFERHLRIKILKKAAFDYADFTVSLYNRGGSEESFSNLKANTYNLENGQVVISKLDKKSTFKEKVDLHHNNVKFTLPNVKEGSIIEIYYKIYSDFLSIPDWNFQRRVPVLYSEYILHIPEYFNYKFFQNGYESIQKTEKTESTSFNYTWFETDDVGMRVPNSTHIQKVDYVANISSYTGVNIKAFHDEPHMKSSKNYISSLENELQSMHMPHSLVKNFASDWKSIAKELLDYEFFGDIIKRQNPTNDLVNTATKGLTDPLQKATAIYNSIRNQFKWNGSNYLYATKGIRKIIDDKSGNSAELNLLLIAALRNAGLKAEPVVLSTRDNGMILMAFPVLQKLNYVIATLSIGDKQYLIDVTDKYAPFGLLPAKCINGQGRIISDEFPGDVDLVSKTNYLTNITNSITIDENGDIKGTWSEFDKGYAANNLRKDVSNAKSKDDYIQDYQKSNPGLTVKSYTFDNLDSLHREVSMNYDYSLANKVEMTGDLMMIHPLLTEQLDENIFKSEIRKFPVDFNYMTSNTYLITIEIPKGYKIESVPKSISIGLPERSITMMYSTSVTENKIQLIRKFTINKEMFLPDDYTSLKEFYNQRVAKEAEVIVLKKI